MRLFHSFPAPFLFLSSAFAEIREFWAESGDWEAVHTEFPVIFPCSQGLAVRNAHPLLRMVLSCSGGRAGAPGIHAPKLLRPLLQGGEHVGADFFWGGVAID